MSLQELLGRLGEHWNRLGSPLREAAQPGLLDDELDEIMRPTGVQLPEELLEWWRWHNGTSFRDALALEASICSASWVLLGIQPAVAKYAQFRELFVDPADYS